MYCLPICCHKLCTYILIRGTSWLTYAFHLKISLFIHWAQYLGRYHKIIVLKLQYLWSNNTLFYRYISDTKIHLFYHFSYGTRKTCSPCITTKLFSCGPTQFFVLFNFNLCTRLCTRCSLDSSGWCSCRYRCSMGCKRSTSSWNRSITWIKPSKNLNIKVLKST